MSGKTKIAFLGTGLMGAPMARRLLGAGFSVTVWNRDAAKAEPLAADGADIAASPADAVAGAAIVFTMLTNGQAVSEVLFERGVADSLAEGTIVVDCSSIAPQIAREHARRLAEKASATSTHRFQAAWWARPPVRSPSWPAAMAPRSKA